MIACVRFALNLVRGDFESKFSERTVSQKQKGVQHCTCFDPPKKNSGLKARTSMRVIVRAFNPQFSFKTQVQFWPDFEQILFGRSDTSHSHIPVKPYHPDTLIAWNEFDWSFKGGARIAWCLWRQAIQAPPLNNHSQIYFTLSRCIMMKRVNTFTCSQYWCSWFCRVKHMVTFILEDTVECVAGFYVSYCWKTVMVMWCVQQTYAKQLQLCRFEIG